MSRKSFQYSALKIFLKVLIQHLNHVAELTEKSKRNLTKGNLPMLEKKVENVFPES